MINKGNQWLWHLDPEYPRKLVAAEFFQPHGVDGLRLWYGCEMRARAAYYRLLLADTPGLSFLDASLESLASEQGVSALLSALGEERQQAGGLSLPARRNVSGDTVQGADEPIARVVQEMQFDPVRIASAYIAHGYRLGVHIEAPGSSLDDASYPPRKRL
jgi:hypothetical protein